MQEGYFQLSRRSFVGVAGTSGLLLSVHELSIAKPTTLLHPAALAHPAPHAHLKAAPGWSGSPGQARYRIEGMAKVTGQKIYARDFRAKDMAGWPANERVAMIVRAQDATRLFTGINLDVLPAELKPLRTILQPDLLTLKLELPFSMGAPASGQPGEGGSCTNVQTPAKQLLVQPGTQPQFYGQAVAILIFKDGQHYRAAKRILQFNPSLVSYGAVAPASCFEAYSPINYLTRYDGPSTPVGSPPFSQVQLGFESNPFAANNCGHPYNTLAAQMRTLIDQSLANPAYKTFGGTFSTQVLDPMFMEPESGLAWLDSSSATMHLVLGTQATNGDVNDIAVMLGSKESRVKVGQVSLYSCYPGGGFGGRDVSTFPPLLAVAAALSDAPVRIAQDRYEQFQSGLKQLASKITHSLAVDSSGNFVAFKSQQSLPSGGNNNYSQFVAMLTAYCGLSGYNIKQAYVDATAQPSLGVVAGSMRGFGGPQASFAVESLVDAAAVSLGRDPIALREQNVLKTGDRTITGAPLTQTMKLAEICRLARSHSLWTQREQVKLEKARQGIAYGVGFALANQAYGTGTDGVMAEVSISPSGELSVRSNCVDMGNGSATTLAISTAGFAGNNAAQVQMGDVGTFAALKMTTFAPLVPCPVPNPPPPSPWVSNPAYTASFSMSSSACLTAFHQVHVTNQATRALLDAALLPAAALLWNQPLSALQGKTAWQGGALILPGSLSLQPLSMAMLAAQIYSVGLPKAAMVHGLYQGTWVSASYLLSGSLRAMPIDGLALQSSASGQAWQVITRQNVIPPAPNAQLYGRSLYAPSGALVAVEINPQTGQPKVMQVELWVDAGKVLQPDLLLGQAQGGIAMGIGYALLENLPLEAGGAGDGRWNLDRYHVALASDMPRILNITPLPTTEQTAKGIAEAVLCPIAPAIGNAIAHATGKRFNSLPITAAQIKGA